MTWTDHALISGWPLLLGGLIQTLGLTFCVLMVAVFLGMGLGCLRFYKVPVLGGLATGYIEALRSVPLILFLVLMHYGIVTQWFPGAHFLLSSFIAFSLFEAAYMAEIIRGGLHSITDAERESANSIGLSPWQRLRLVEIPLATSRTMPALVGQTITLLKDTSLASIVGVVEFTRAGEILYEQTYEDMEILVLQAFIYFGLCFTLSRFGRHLESNPFAQPYRMENLRLKSIQG